MKQLPALVQAIIAGIQEKKGYNIVVADLRNIVTAPCQYFVIAQGNSPQQVQAIAKSVTDFTIKEVQEKPANTVGLPQAQWVAQDFGTVLVHIFLPELRAYYDIEHLWDDAQCTHIPDEL